MTSLNFEIFSGADFTKASCASKIVCARAVRFSSDGIGRTCPSFPTPLTRTLKRWSKPRLERVSAFRSIEIDDRQRTFAELAKPKRDPGQRAHKRRIHPLTIAQIDDKLARTAMDHLLGKLSQSRAVGGRTVSLHPNPNDTIRTTHQYFGSWFHRFCVPADFRSCCLPFWTFMVRTKLAAV